MAYRAGLFGGSVQIKNRKNGGARVRCICPLEPKNTVKARQRALSQSAPGRPRGP